MDQFVASGNFNGAKAKSRLKDKNFFWKYLAKAYIWLFVLLLVYILGLVSGASSGGRGVTDSAVIKKAADVQLAEIFKNNKGIDVSIFGEVWDLLHRDYLDKYKLDDKNLFYGAVAGMVDALGDPHSVFLNPKSTDQFSRELDGSFYGIGAEIGKKNGLLVVVAPLDGSPAAKAGLMAGDRILAIDSKDTAKISVSEAIYLIRGDEGQAVVLKIIPKDQGVAKDVSIVRAKIDIPSVRYRLEKNTAIITITDFNNDTGDRFTSVAQKVLKDNPRGIILDLRNNPGGFLSVAVEIASSWLTPGQVVVRETYSEKANDTDHQAVKKLSLSKYRTVVLVNEGSASAAEIMAGALQDYGLAQVVGMVTFGKGSVQQLIPLKDNSSVKLTVARWLTPKGRTIEGQGITPDIKIDLTEEDYNKNLDPQLEKALELILK